MAGWLGGSWGSPAAQLPSDRDTGADLPSVCDAEDDSEYPAQRLGGAPEQLVADGERREVLRSHGELAQAADRRAQRAGHCGWRQLAQRALLLVRHHLHPLVRTREQRLDIAE